MAERKQLRRSTTNKVLLGVFGGLGEYLGVDPVLLRVIFVVALVFTAFLPGVLAYFIAAAVIPTAPRQG